MKAPWKRSPVSGRVALIRGRSFVTTSPTWSASRRKMRLAASGSSRSPVKGAALPDLVDPDLAVGIDHHLHHPLVCESSGDNRAHGLAEGGDLAIGDDGGALGHGGPLSQSVIVIVRAVVVDALGAKVVRRIDLRRRGHRRLHALERRWRRADGAHPLPVDLSRIGDVGGARLLLVSRRLAVEIVPRPRLEEGLLIVADLVRQDRLGVVDEQELLACRRARARPPPTGCSAAARTGRSSGARGRTGCADR